MVGSYGLHAHEGTLHVPQFVRISPSRLRDSQAEATITPPTKGSSAATIATTEASDKANQDSFHGRFADNFNGIN